MPSSLASTKTAKQSLPKKLVDILSQYQKLLHLQENKSAHTSRSYAQQAQTLLEFLYLENKTSKISELLAPQSLRAHLRESSQSLYTSSQAQKVSALKHFLAFLIKTQELAPEILRHLERPRSSNKVPEIIPEDLLLQLARHIKEKRPPAEQLLFFLLYGSGLRISEAQSLSWQQLKQGLTGQIEVLGKGRKRRAVPIPRSAQDLIREHFLKAQPPQSSGPLSHDVRSLRRWVENWALLLPENEFRLKPHQLRHTLASHLLKRGAQLPQIQRLLGHARLTTTERYTHLDLDDLIRVYDQSFGQKKSR
jgi:integrase/recombinase XerC